MEKKKILLVLLISIVSLSLIYLIGTRISGMFLGFGQPATEFKWWNVTWHYRVRLEINSTQYNRTDWPIEHRINFTDLLPSGTFDENSTRIIEYNSTGLVLYEVPSQFDKDDNYDSSANAVGTLVFLMNGTTLADTKRIFYVYYDKTENGAKQYPSYTNNINYSWSGEEFNVNNTVLSLWVDTVRGENTSGIIRVIDKTTPPGYDVLRWNPLPSDERTYEYMTFSNETYNFSFDFRNNATLKYSGPIRIVVEQKGNEVLWNSTNATEGFAIKRYTFYDKQKWIKVEINYTNIGSNSITRNSTFAGAITLDAQRAFDYGTGWHSEYGNTSYPGWWYASDFWNDYQAGIIHVNQTGTNNFWVPNCTSTDRIGVQLNSTNINAGSSIFETAVFRFSYQNNYPDVINLRDRLDDQAKINQSLPERWYVITTPLTDQSIYNRNESILITGNISYDDPYNLTEYMNATLDMGTASVGDDQTVALYDDGTHGDVNSADKIFTNTFNISNDANVSVWSINFTTYTNNSEFLNLTLSYFNVTDMLNVTVNMTNKKPLVNSIVFANVYVKNYRQDIWISGATINCSYNSTEITNKTDYNNGTYSINFTVPNQEGSYTVYCNATKNQNFGNNTDTISAETAKTTVAISSLPSNPFVSNVSLYYNDSFIIVANATNIANGTAYLSNISLELLNDWSSNITVENCGDIEKNSYCIKAFNITVPNATVPGNYYINTTVTWKNPDETQSSNKTQINVTVDSNPKVDVEESKVSNYAGDGVWNIIGNFTVFSTGNDQITNVTFSCYSGTVCNDFVVSFTPINITSLASGSKQNVSINVTIPLAYSAGNYTGLINVSAQNNKFDIFTLEVNISTITNVSIINSISSYIAYLVTQQTSESFEFISNVTNSGNSSARYSNISLILPSGWTSNSSLEYCDNITKDSTCYKSFNVTIPQGTLAGNYLVNITANWTNLGNTLGTNKTYINVTVASGPLINIVESNVSGSVVDGTNNYIGNFTVLSIGNDALQNITFNCYQGIVCQNFLINFTPSNISNLAVGLNQTVKVNVTVPIGYLAGTYNGTVNASAQNDHYKNLTLFVDVPSNRTWLMNPTNCQRSEYPDEGTVCDVLIRNIGNDIINFTISPEYGNHTKVNVTNFFVNATTNYSFNITYNMTGVSQATYNSLFTVDVVQSNANPDNRTLNVTLYPYLPPEINVSIVPTSIEQNSSVEIYANITDRSNSGIVWTNVSIIRPNGITNQTNMALLNQSGNLSQWYFKYPGSLGDTNLRGFYNVTVSSSDSIGNAGNLTSNFTVYTKLIITSTTLSNTYLQGDTGSIYYFVRNMSGVGLNNTNVSFIIKDATNNISYYTEQRTNADGTVSPMPSFNLASDVLTGNYTLYSNTTYYDSTVDKVIIVEKNSTFQVQSRTISVSGLFADIETVVVWYPNNVMRFGILIYNGEGRPVDPTAMNLSVYDPANNIYLAVNLSSMTKRAIGYYTYQYAMPPATATGMYLAVLNVTQNEFQTMKLKAFRVAQGGPYDVRLNLFENEVPQGDYLDFSLIIENKGEVTQDVFVEYWVSSQNTTYYTSSEAVLTPALSNQSFTRNAYIYSSQPLGTYYLTAKVTWDNVQSPIYANKTFMVIAKTVPQPPPNVTPPGPSTLYIYPAPTGGTVTVTQPSEKVSASIMITSYNSNVTLARNFTKIESVTVKNSGFVELSNISLYILGIPLDWIKITPERYASLGPENYSIFLVEFNIPKNAKPDDYKANLVATAGVVSDQKSINIKIYQSLEELLRNDIKKYKEELQDLYIEIKIAEKEGKDISTVLTLYNEAKSKITDAEQDLENNNLEDALDKISNVPKLINRIKDVLDSLEKPKEKEVGMPFFMILTIFIVIIFAMILIVFVWKRKKITKIRPYIIPLGRIVEAVKKKSVSKEEMEAEKEKLARMLRILDKEKQEGIITGSSYEKMKKSIEEKLDKLEKK